RLVFQSVVETKYATVLPSGESCGENRRDNSARPTSVNGRRFWAWVALPEQRTVQPRTRHVTAPLYDFIRHSCRHRRRQSIGRPIRASYGVWSVEVLVSFLSSSGAFSHVNGRLVAYFSNHSISALSLKS